VGIWNCFEKKIRSQKEDLFKSLRQPHLMKDEETNLTDKRGRDRHGRPGACGQNEAKVITAPYKEEVTEDVITVRRV